MYTPSTSEFQCALESCTIFREALHYVYFTVIASVLVNLHTMHTPHRLKLPEYQSYRETLGVARSIDSIEQAIAELKSLLLVSFNAPMYIIRCAPLEMLFCLFCRSLIVQILAENHGL